MAFDLSGGSASPIYHYIQIHITIASKPCPTPAAVITALMLTGDNGGA